MNKDMTNGFTKKTVGTMTLGEKLRKLRGDKRMSLGEISRVTRIQASYLEYLENGEWSKLPADVYVRGFLRSYADFLGVDERILLKSYEKEKGIMKNLEKNNKNKKEKPDPVRISSFVFTPRKILVSVVVILVIFGAWFLYRELNSFTSAPSLVILGPQNNYETDDNFVFIEGLTEKDAAVFVGGQVVFVNDDGKFREKLNLQPGINLIDIKAINKFEKETEKNITVKSNQLLPSESNKNESEINENVLLKMDLRVDPGPVWLSVTADDRVVFSGNMLTGAVQSFSAQNKIVISSGQGNATFVTLNGQDLGVLSEEPGAVKDKEFTREN